MHSQHCCYGQGAIHILRKLFVGGSVIGYFCLFLLQKHSFVRDRGVELPKILIT